MADFTFTLRIQGTANGKSVDRTLTMTVASFTAAREMAGSNIPTLPNILPGEWPGEPDAVLIQHTGKTGMVYAKLANVSASCAVDFLLPPQQFFIAHKSAATDIFDADTSATAVTLETVEAIQAMAMFDKASFSLLHVNI